VFWTSAKAFLELRAVQKPRRTDAGNTKTRPNKEDAERYAFKKHYKGLRHSLFRIMLILSRRINETIVIDGRILVRVVRVDGDVVKLGIQAPKDIPVHRLEVYEEIQRENQEALTKGRPPVPHRHK
jgi:carbon storage regulator